MIPELIKIQNELKAPKNRRNTFGNYQYRSAEDILTAVKPLLEKYDCQLTLSDAVQEIGGRVYVIATALIENKEEKKECVLGYARESESKKGMDDSQITGTASSYARKYALNGLFLIDDTKDPDTDEYRQEAEARAAKEAVEDKPIGIVKGQALLTVLEEAGVDVDKLLKQKKVKTISELTEAQHLAIIEQVRKRENGRKD